VIITEAGVVELVNHASLDYHQRGLDEIKLWKASDLVHPEDLAATVAALQGAFTTGEPVEHEHRLRRADGEYRWFQLRGVRARDHGDGAFRWYKPGD